MSQKTYKVVRMTEGHDEVYAETFTVEGGAAVFFNIDGERIWCFAPGTWKDVVLLDSED